MWLQEIVFVPLPHFGRLTEIVIGFSSPRHINIMMKFNVFDLISVSLSKPGLFFLKVRAGVNEKGVYDRTKRNKRVSY